MGHGILFAVVESRGEPGRGIAVPSRDSVPCPGWERLAKLHKQLAPLFPELGLFSGYTTVVSVIWQLSSALKETFIKEIEYILLSPLHFLGRSAKGGMFPLSHSFFHPLSFVSRCYWGSISTHLHMVKHVPKSWYNVTRKTQQKKAEHAAKKVSGTLNIVEHHWPPLGWDTHCRSPKLGTGTSSMCWAHGQINICLHCKVPCLRREGEQLCFRSHTTGMGPNQAYRCSLCPSWVE